jgi:hypothetical protein
MFQAQRRCLKNRGSDIFLDASNPAQFCLISPPDPKRRPCLVRS